MKKETQKEFAKFLIDVAKLIIGGGILASILKFDDIDKTKLVFYCSSVTLIFLILGFINSQ